MLILWIGGSHVINGNISIGQLITFNAFLGYYYGLIQDLIQLQPKLQEAYVALDHLVDSLDLKAEKQKEQSKIKCEHLKGKIEIENLDFRYGTRKKVLKNINLSIKPGDKIALVGGSGSGKTTLVKLLLKYYLPEEGKILFDDYNVEDISLEHLRAKIGYVPQEIFLFSGTVKENIAFGQQNVSMEKIVQASRKAQAHQFINDLPLRYDAMVGERGSNLSGGQRQRIAIARAILKDPDILILDEATSNLDTATEKAIHHTIENVSQGITTIIIAHRLSTIRECDKIVVMEEGKIIEKGTHQRLLKQKGQYYKLWEGQTLEEIEIEGDTA